MECFVLGSGGMMPMPRRRLTSIAVRLEGRIYLLDCGEGTQVPYKEKHLGLRNLDVIATTHMHADHVLGLPGMLMLRAQMPDPGPLTLLGTMGLKRFVRNLRADLGMYINYPIRVVEWTKESGALAYEDDQVRIFWHRLDHTVPCVGYRIEERDLPGRFDLEAAQTLGVPRGPLWGRLQAGHPVQLENGAVVRPEQVLGKTRRGRHIAYATDTKLTPRLQPLLEESDLAFVESMFAPEEEEDAAAKKHMTVVQAASAASAARVDRLVLVHISPRYEQESVRRIAAVAEREHANAEVARDGRVYTLPVPA
jgi:ribonuclease Z